MSFFREMIDFQTLLQSFNIQCLVPESDASWPGHLTVNLEIALKRRASFAHMRKIRDPRTFAIIVLNHDKYGVKNYIGANSLAEIAVAAVGKKRVYLANGVPDTFRDELVAWGVRPLYGDIDLLVQDFQSTCRPTPLQLEMF